MSRARDLANLGDGIAVADLPNTVVVKDGSNDVTLNNITATGVYLGGTGAANYLDDYEEGTFTATLTVHNGTPPTTPPTSTGVYTKIGTVCHVIIDFGNANVSGASGELSVDGLPFAAVGTQGLGSPFTYNININNAYNAFYVGDGNTNIRLYRMLSNAQWEPVTLDTTSGNKYLWHTFTYKV